MADEEAAGVLPKLPQGTRRSFLRYVLVSES